MGVSGNTYVGAGYSDIGQATASSLNVSATTLVKAGPCRLARVSVITAGAAGAVHDCATTGGIAAGTKIGVIPATVGIYYFDWPCSLGLVYELGAGQVVSISYTY